MESIKARFITICLGLAFLLFNYVVDFLAGLLNAKLVKKEKFNIKKMSKDLLKAIIFCIVSILLFIDYEGLSYFTQKCGLDIREFGDVLSTSAIAVILIWKSVVYMLNATNNYKEYLNYKDEAKEQIDKANVDYKGIAEDVKNLVGDIKEYWEAHAKWEEEAKKSGNLGYVYSVPIDTYDAFRNATMGNRYDIDGCYGAQCWDGACLLWTQIGRRLDTGRNNAKGTWLNRKDQNAGNDFELIYSKADIRRGDICVFNCGDCGHIGFADENYKGTNYIQLYGQNQGARAGANGTEFNLINMNLSTFLGAFRFKRWSGSQPTPTPTPSGDTIEYTYQTGDTFGAVLVKLGLDEGHLWGADGTVAYYSNQLREQGALDERGNVIVGKKIVLKRKQ